MEFPPPRNWGDRGIIGPFWVNYRFKTERFVESYQSDNDILKTIIRQKLADSLERPLPSLTPRRIWIPAISGKAKAIIGMRRSGKTSLMYQLMSEAVESGIPRDRIVYFSFEDERLAGMDAGHLSEIIEEYYRQFPSFRNRETVSFFLDEIQVVPGWEPFARRILDSEKIDLHLSGSSGRLLSREVATSMRGRAVEVEVYPFSFTESLRHSGVTIPDKPEFLSGKEHSHIENAFHDYLCDGGFPEAQNLNQREHRQLLQGYVDVVILRDIAERHKLTNLPAIRWLVRQLLANAGGDFSANKFRNDLQSQKIPVSIESILSIYGHLEDAYLIRGVSIEAGSERKRQVNPRKTYPIDPGLIRAYDRTGRENLGHALENAVLIELLRRGAEVTWVRTPGGFEIDFLARLPCGEMELIQVSTELEDPATVEREFRALVDIRPVYKNARLRLLTLHLETNLNVPKDLDVEITPAYEWMLKQPD